MIPLTEFLGKIDEIRGSAPAYRLGGDGSDGTCDCVGLAIGAIRRAGGEWPGLHGSNYAARNVMAGLCRRREAELLPGWLAFKAHAPGEAGYRLPERYKASGDLMDYYHVGVVTSVAPLRITHCTTGGGVDGIAVDTRQGKWRYAGPCALINYGGEKGMEKARVRAAQGSSVNLRRGASHQAEVVARLKVGEEVTVLSWGNGWAHVGSGSRTGYMMTEFLEGLAEKIQEPPAGLLAELKALIKKYGGGA